VRLNVCSSSLFMPNCTEVMGSIAPALTCRHATGQAQARTGVSGRSAAQRKAASRVASDIGSAHSGNRSTLLHQNRASEQSSDS
jgi:hypothetical protein